MTVQFELNGRLHQAETEAGSSLLEYLRDQEIFSVKHGCDHGECGACAVLLNGKAVNACLLLMHTLEGQKVETLESFSNHEQLHALQESFLAEGAVQCGFCTPGMIMSLEALDREGNEINEEAVKDALTGNLCRCTGYVKPVAAALKVLKNNRSSGGKS